MNVAIEDAPQLPRRSEFGRAMASACGTGMLLMIWIVAFAYHMDWSTQPPQEDYLLQFLPGQYLLTFAAGLRFRSAWSGALIGVVVSICAGLGLIVSSTRASDLDSFLWSSSGSFLFYGIGQWIFMTLPLAVAGAATSRLRRSADHSRRSKALLGCIAVLLVASFLYAFPRFRCASGRMDLTTNSP